MRHDDVVAVDRAHQIADHAVLVERRLVGIQEFRPFAEPSLFPGRDLLLERRERVAAARPLLARHLGDQRIEHQRRVAHQGVIGAILLVDVARVVGGMDDGLVRRHARAERRTREA